MNLEIKGVLEGLLFASGEAGISLNQMMKVLNISEPAIKHLLDELKFDYEHVNRGLCIIESKKIYHLSTKPEHSMYYKALRESDQSSKMSQATLETLSIIVYKQPITKTEIDDIRGVQSGSAIQNLLQRHLIEITGRKETPGRPYLYSTTKQFLSYFGITNLNELPPINVENDGTNLNKTNLFSLNINDKH